MRVRRVALAALVFAAFLALSASAGANVIHFSLPAGQFIHIELGSSNGYSIHIRAGDHGLRPGVSLETKKEGVGTEYFVRNGQVSADRVEAKLSGLGSISVRFHQRGPARHPSLSDHCDGPRLTVRQGVVRGTIRFVGEREYTRVEAHSAKAEIEEWRRQRCRLNVPPRGGRKRPWTSEFQEWGKRGLSTFFTAKKYRPGILKGGRVHFDIWTTATRRNLHITRSAALVAPASTFQIPEPDTYPEHVILTPPPPFNGTGTFARTPESVFTWEGDLSIQFPGIDPIPLTGPSFSPHYCALRDCISQDAEEPEAGLHRPVEFDAPVRPWHVRRRASRLAY